MAEYEAGRDLDALIARRVFGAETRIWPSDGKRYGLRDDMPIGALPSFSTTITGAWRLIEHMRAEWFFGCRDWYEDDRDWYVSFQRGDDAPEGLASYCGEGVAPTFPLAVCRAALQALDKP